MSVVCLDDELPRAERFFEEAIRLQAVNPELVSSRTFYDIWEENERPTPFSLAEGAEIEFLGHRIVPEIEGAAICCFDWDADEACVCLVVEGENTTQQFNFFIEDGHTRVSPEPVTYDDDGELTFGERLEVMYDIVAYLRKERPSVDLFNITLAEYRAALFKTTDSYSQRTIRVMRRLNRSTVHKLLNKVVEDMAADEVSDQLVLPLDGTYAMVGEQREPESSIAEKDVTFRIETRTFWSIHREIDFMQEAYDKLARVTEHTILTFEEAEVLHDAGRKVILKLPVNQNQPVAEGDRLPVFMRGENAPVARFAIDLHEGSHIVGHFSWNDVPVDDQISTRLYARPRRGPAHFIAGVLSSLLANFREQKTFGSPALNALLGVEEVILNRHGSPRELGEAVDESQSHALSDATDAQNTMVVVQGPPGTGKTHVMEALIRQLTSDRQRILITAPSNAAIDNICRRVMDLAVLRLGREKNSIAPDIQSSCWLHNPKSVQRFKQRRETCGSIYAGTHVGILRDELVMADEEQNGSYDVIIFDEAGMTSLAEFILCARLAKRVVLFGDHQQLPPFPFPDDVKSHLKAYTTANRRMWATVTMSALEWLVETRGVPVHLLRASYRCQNPRLMRFSSTLFYNARVKASEHAEYYQLSFSERVQRFPSSTLRLYRTSSLPLEVRREQLVFTGSRPGLENQVEAKLAIRLFYQLIREYPLGEITIITPYRRQAKLIREGLSFPLTCEIMGESAPDEEVWKSFLFSRISTVDSFQGGESDVVIITYVRSNDDGGIGFVDDPNRVNVAHTRCRRQMIVIGDIEYLKKHARNTIFERMERAFERDGELVDVSYEMAADVPATADEVELTST